MLEALAGERCRECARVGAVELRRHGNNYGRRQVVRKTSLDRRASLLSVYFFDADFTGKALSTLSRSSVHKNNGADPADSFRQLRRELVQAQNFDLRRGEFCFQRVGDAPSKAVVGAQRIPVGDNEHSNSRCPAQRHELGRGVRQISSFAPLGLESSPLASPRLTLWALFCRRFAAGNTHRTRHPARPVPPRQARMVSTGQGAFAITWWAVDHGRCVVPTSAELRAPSTIRSASRSSANLRIHSLAEPNSSNVSGA